MNRLLPLLALVAVLGCERSHMLTPDTPPANNAWGRFGPKPAPLASFVVTLTPAARPEGVAAAHGVHPDFFYSEVLNGFSARLPEAAVAALGRDSRVQRIEPDIEITTMQGKKENESGGSQLAWGLDRIDQRPTRLDNRYVYFFTGAGVTAYIVDTGIRYDHEEFGGRASFGYDIQKGNGGSDCHGHGTHVAGTVGGRTYGVAKAVSLVSVRVLDCTGSGTLKGVLAGLEWIAKNAKRPAVANMSLGGGFSATLNDAVENLVSMGVPVVVAAGNSRADACRYSPASAPSAMTIGATDPTDTRAGFSNFGACVDWFAPGVAVESAWITSSTATYTASGTSMASPHAAGAAALYLEGDPGATAERVRDALFDFTTKCVVQDARSENWHLLHSLEQEMSEDCGPPPGFDDPLLAPTITSATASTTSVSVRVAWSNPNQFADVYELQWRPQGTEWSTSLQKTGTPSKTNGLTLSGGILEPSTTYEFRVRVGYTPQERYSEWSNVASATTCAAKGKSGKCS